ncbi:MAG: sigma-54-dependent Fis family transcriptional regulator [Planctomycetota bacterium]|nr:sigma-54-dependent Fis family transcriptional regulator [Planctomycetota bacterium]
MCHFLRLALRRHGFDVEFKSDAAEAFTRVGEAQFDAVITDLNMRGMNGIELCERIAANHADLPVLVLTAFGRLDTAIAAMRAGAYDFITKPFDVQVLALALRRAVQHHSLREEVKRLRESKFGPERFEELVGDSEPMRALYRLLEQVAAVDSSVLIQGETGTGKELVARALHRRSARAKGPFVAVNCAAVPETLLESELFGHVKGAFSGALSDSPGLLRRAHGGTLLLDEVGDMPLALQAKLLRALEERRVRPVGGGEERDFDARIVVATHMDLEAAVEEGRFRQDLFFRLNVIAVDLPPLRARGGDVLGLAQMFIEQQAARTGKHVAGLTGPAAERLLAYSWPGNVRELRNCIERAVALTAHERLIVEDLPAGIRDYRTTSPALVPEASDSSQLPTLEEVERRYVLRVLDTVGGNKKLASRVLGLDRRTLYRKLERWRLGGGAAAGEPEEQDEPPVASS